MLQVKGIKGYAWLLPVNTFITSKIVGVDDPAVGFVLLYAYPTHDTLCLTAILRSIIDTTRSPPFS